MIATGTIAISRPIAAIRPPRAIDSARPIRSANLPKTGWEIAWARPKIGK